MATSNDINGGQTPIRAQGSQQPLLQQSGGSRKLGNLANSGLDSNQHQHHQGLPFQENFTSQQHGVRSNSSECTHGLCPCAQRALQQQQQARERESEDRIHVLYNNVNMGFLDLAFECMWEWITVGFLLTLASYSNKIEPFHRIAFMTDQSISFPHTGKQTVPFYMLMLFCCGVPLATIILFSVVKSKSSFRLHNATLGLCLSISFTFFFQQVVKLTVGSLRPDFLARCVPRYDNSTILLEVIECMGDPKVVREGRKSFFSGHSALSFAGLNFLALFLTQELDLRSKPLAPKYFLIIMPIILALVIAISRVDDYWHRWQDITVGAIVGITTSSISFISHCKYDTTILRLLSKNVADAAADAIEPVSSRRDSVVDVD